MREGCSEGERWKGCWCGTVYCDGECHGGSGSDVYASLHLGLRVDYHGDLCVGCVYARLYLCVCCASADWDCCCAMSVRTSRGSCSSSESHTARIVGPLEGGGVGDSMQYCSGVLSGATESKRGRRFWRGQGGRTGVEEGWAWVGKGEMRHWVRGRRRTLQDIRLDNALQRKGWRGGQSKGKGTHKGPGGSWKVVQDWEWPRERGYYCLHYNSPAHPGTIQTPRDLQQSLVLLLQMQRQLCPCLWPLVAVLSDMETNPLCLL